ncbi:hypothetical protein M2138_000315 [Dysgonomonadaceae bacterium PH5-43]|nr:hypothetical protein [Dysgonomonadaceae bacterium PH5-43]
MKKSILLILLTVTAFVSCNNNRIEKDSDQVFIEESVNYLTAGSEMFSKIELIPLQETEDYLVGDISKIIPVGTNYYILDSKKSKALYLYDKDGKPINKFQKIGGGPDEYIEIWDFVVDSIAKEVSIYCLPPKIITTDLNLNIKGEAVTVDFYADRMTKHDNNLLFYNHRDRSVKSYDINSGNITELIKREGMSADIIDSSPVFYSVYGKLYFQSPGDDCIFVFEDGLFKPFFELDYNNKEKIMKFYTEKGIPDITFEERMSNPLPYVWCVFEKDKHISFLYTYNSIGRMYTYMGEKYVDQIIRFFPATKSMVYSNNCLYAWDYPYNLKIMKIKEFDDFMSDVVIGDTKLTAIGDDNYENPVIFVYHLN